MEFLKRFDLKRPKELIGVDIGTTCIKMCVLKNSKEGFTIECMDSKSFDENLLSDGCIINNAFLADELKDMVLKNNIKTKEAACALSSYSVISKKVTMPFLREEEIESSISVEVESVIPFPLKDIYYSYYVIGVAEDKQDMMEVQVVAAKKEIIDGYIATFNMAGLNLQLVDVDIFCLTNLIETVYAPQDSSVVVADIGSSVTNIAIAKGDRIEFTREILVGGQNLTGQIEKSTNLTHKEAEAKKLTGDSEVSSLFEDFIYNISSEISKTINFYTSTKTRERIDKVYLTGGTSLLPGLKATIEDNTKVDVEYIDPFLCLNEDVGKLETYEDFRGSIAVALYLSSRAVDVIGL
ncbi:MAG: Competence protein A [Syntrophorhabdus sp. PtaU1.Bin002]|nr:MAG: Competence protein A [Syntrophorhabdus sp. PtaB.Bin006]OPY72328.1 MAG: Competence protein A [Syntrophorhabdus sp. PtaU1.Bin002]